MPKIIKPPRVFVCFGGDPSDDKECYKRYSSTEPFNAIDFSEEVVEFINKERVEKLIAAVKYEIEIDKRNGTQGYSNGAQRRLAGVLLEYGENTNDT